MNLLHMISVLATSILGSTGIMGGRTPPTYRKAEKRSVEQQAIAMAAAEAKRQRRIDKAKKNGVSK